MRVVIIALVLLGGCQQVAERCGTGTVEMDGVCMPALEPSPAACGPGTELDEPSGTCVAEPAAPLACENGTRCAGDPDTCVCDGSCEEATP